MTNIDHDEIAKFDQQAKDWWDLQGPFKTLHHINPTRLGFIQAKVNLANLKVLDVGCGGGILSEAMAKAGAQVTGIDMAGDVLQVARQHAKQNNTTLDYQQIEVGEFAKQLQHQFDVVTCLELLEHVPEPHAIIDACAQALKPGGHCFLSTLNRTPKSFMFAIVGAEYIMNLLPRGTHHYDKFIKPSELHRWCRDAGLAVEELKGMWYQPFTHKSGLNDDLGVNYLAHTIKK